MSGRDVKILIFISVTLLTAGLIAFAGTIGFVGLVAPNIARILVGEDQRFLLPMAAIVGAVVMVAASILSKLVSPGVVVPIGIGTAVISVPFLFFDRARAEAILVTLEVQGLTVAYGANRVIDNLSGILLSGKLAVLIGPSGSGKSTLLRDLAELPSC